MKNSLNLVLVIFMFIVLGCACPNLSKFTKKTESTPEKTPTVANSETNPRNSSSKSSSNLTLGKFKQIKDGMSYKEVVEIIGSEGIETASSGKGKYKVMTYQWKDDNFKFIYCVFMGDKMTSKTQANLE